MVRAGATIPARSGANLPRRHNVRRDPTRTNARRTAGQDRALAGTLSQPDAVVGNELDAGNVERVLNVVYGAVRYGYAALKTLNRVRRHISCTRKLADTQAKSGPRHLALRCGNTGHVTISLAR